MKTKSVLWMLAFCLAVSPAFGQDRFATAGRIAVGAERVFGYASTTTKVETEFQPGNVKFERESTKTQLDFLARGDVGNPFVAPRVGLDYFVIDGLSVGGSVAYVSDDEESEETLGNNTNQLPDEKGSGFVIAPRAGYCFMFNDMVGLWPRGGFTYASAKEETDASGPGQTDSKYEASLFDLTLEAMLVVTPVPHAGFMVGPTLDLPLSGSGELEQGNNSQDLDEVKVTTIALQAGVFAWF
ncbi:MAG: hypothetical protein IT377_22380 [Polyangiaceae bacterium]|nr:hypothetical protein [Polyangiaceae bacterium]